MGRGSQLTLTHQTLLAPFCSVQPFHTEGGHGKTLPPQITAALVCPVSIATKIHAEEKPWQSNGKKSCPLLVWPCARFLAALHVGLTTLGTATGTFPQHSHGAHHWRALPPIETLTKWGGQTLLKDRPTNERVEEWVREDTSHVA